MRPCRPYCWDSSSAVQAGVPGQALLDLLDHFENHPLDRRRLWPAGMDPILQHKFLHLFRRAIPARHGGMDMAFKRNLGSGDTNPDKRDPPARPLVQSVIAAPHLAEHEVMDRFEIRR